MPAPMELLYGLCNHAALLTTAAIACSLAVCVICTLLKGRVLAIGAPQRVPPGAVAAPGALPLLGHILPVLQNQQRLLNYIHEVSLAMDQKTWYWSLPFMPVYINIFQPQNLEHVLRTRFDNYPKGPYWQNRLACLLGDGIFNADGESWRLQRKTASHMFNVKSFRQYFERIFAETMPALLVRLQRCSDGGYPVDVQDLLYRFMLDSFCKIGFSADIGCLAGEEQPPFASAFDRTQMILNRRFFMPFYHLEEVLTGSRFQLKRDLKVLDDYCHPIIQARRKALDAEGSRLQACKTSTDRNAVHSPPGAITPSPTKFTSTADGIAAAVEVVAAAGTTVISTDSHVSAANGSAATCSKTLAGPTLPGTPAHHAQLQAGACAKNGRGLHSPRSAAAHTCATTNNSAAQSHGSSAEQGVHASTSDGPPSELGSGQPDLLSLFMAQRDEHGHCLSDVELRDRVLNFIIAGRDTTATALAWALVMLAQHPEAAQRVRDEVDNVMAGLPLDAVPSYEQVRAMHWSKAVLLETLRLHPSVPKDAKQALADDMLPDGTFVPAGAIVLYHPFTMGRLECLWGADAALFRPQRWLDSALPSPFEYPVFNAGPRVCLGQRFAELEGVFVLVGILRQFYLELVPGQELVPANSITLPLRYGARFMVRQRHDR